MKYPYGSNLDIVWEEDPKMLGVRLARYKFVAKMFSGMKVIEVGCGDGWLSKIVAQTASELTITDANPPDGIKAWNPIEGPGEFTGYDGAYCLDVLEHVPMEKEGEFIWGIYQALNPKGCLIVGMPSEESQIHASRKSKESHVNCKTEEGLRYLLRGWFSNVFMFGMNDEVVHTGFGPMCHYRLGLAIK